MVGCSHLVEKHPVAASNACAAAAAAYWMNTYSFRFVVDSCDSRFDARQNRSAVSTASQDTVRLLEAR